jgi:peroxiredoxin
VDLAFGVARRKSFLVDSKGNIAKVYENVTPAKHAAEVLEDLKIVS